MARYSPDEYLVAIGEAVGDSGFLRICCKAAGMADIFGEGLMRWRGRKRVVHGDWARGRNRGR